MKIRILFYKARFGDGHWLDNAISIWTGLISAKNRKVGPYSHVEIWMPDNEGDFTYPPMNPRSDTCYQPGNAGTCWTSTMRGKDNGTVKRPASTVIKDAGRWDFVEIEVEEENHKDGVEYMEVEVDCNKGYAKRDLGKFFGLGWLADKWRNICSEFSNNYCVKAKILKGWGVVSPRRLAWKLQKASYQIKQLK